MSAATRILALLSETTPEEFGELDAEITQVEAKLTALRSLRSAVELARQQLPARTKPHVNGAAKKPSPSPSPARPPARQTVKDVDDTDDDEEEELASPPPPSATATKSASMIERRKAIVRLIARQGPCSHADVLALGVPQKSFTTTMRCDWFEREPDGWHITQQARIDVLDVERERV